MSESLPERAVPFARRQWVALGGVFLVLLALLGAGYALFLRPQYMVLAQNLRAPEAAAIVAELDKRGIAHKLRDGGTTILVPEGEVDSTRLAISGTEMASNGQIGFELFNKSDMGLTNFAQKINYQRALQGELVRTLMQMEGVLSARVHLAIPERTLFRGDRSEPKAAVTVEMQPGRLLEPARVAGIQRLVAAAVPDLPEAQVAVLDEDGRVVSPEPAAVIPAGAGTDSRSPESEERVAIEQYYHARARRAVESQLPGLKFALKVLTLPADTSSAAAAGWTLAGEGAARNYRLRMLFITTAALTAEEQGVAREAVRRSAGLDFNRGDSLGFEVGPVDPVQPAPAAPAASASGYPPAVAIRPAAPSDTSASSLWLWGAVGLVLVLVGFWGRRRAGRIELNDAEHEAFAQKLRRQLNLEASDAAA